MDDAWNPMEDDFLDTHFNSYDRGIGRDLPTNRKSPAVWGRNGAKVEKGIDLFVTGIPKTLTKEGLHNMFSSVGSVLDVRKIPPKDDQQDGFCFITVSSTKDAECAIRKYDRFRIQDGRYVLKVTLAISREEKERRRRKKQEDEEFLKTLNGGKSVNGEESGSSSNTNDPAPKNIPSIGRGSLMAQVLQSMPTPGKFTFPTQTGAHSKPQRHGNSTPSGNHGNSTPSGHHGNPTSDVAVTEKKQPAKKKPAESFPCTKCSQLGCRKCSRCKSPYCSQRCQKEDWAHHKAICMTDQQRRKKREEEEFLSRFDVEINDDFVDRIAAQISQEMENTGQKPEAKDHSPRPEENPQEDVTSESPEIENTHSGNHKLVMARHMTHQSLNDLDLVLIIHIPSTQRFYVQKVEMAQQFSDLIDTLQVYKTMSSSGDYLPKRGEAVAAFCQEDDYWYRAEIVDIISQFAMKVRFVDFGNEELVTNEMIHPLSAEFVKLPMQAIPCCLEQSPTKTEEDSLKRKFDQCMVYLEGCRRCTDGVYQVSSIIKKTHQVGTEPGPESIHAVQDIPAGAILGSSVPIQELPSHSSMVCVVWTNHPGEFYIQVDSQKLQFAEEMKRLNDYCQTTAVPYRPQCLGELVCAQWDIWYRAVVVQILPEEAGYVVKFVDYGNTERISSPASLRMMLKEFTSLPCQAVPCGLVGVQGTGHNGSWADADKSFFTQQCDDTRTLALAPSKDKSGDVHCVDLILEDGRRASQLMVDNKHAVTALAIDTPKQKPQIDRVADKRDLEKQLAQLQQQMALISSQIQQNTHA